MKEKLEDCYHCGLSEKDCRCDDLEPNFCKACGKEFKGKYYFSWAIHQAICSYEKEHGKRNEL